ncbi:MAG: 50S ribosomal protein L32e [Methanobacteriota archaeon]|nr:MAG: 50S ribosomal protein L32e [Euryarchaeota archaeon]
MTALPTPPEVRKARKAELVAWCEAFGLDAEGKVDDLRARLLEHIAAAAKPAGAKTPAKAAAKAPAKAPEPKAVKPPLEPEPEKERPEAEEEAEAEEPKKIAPKEKRKKEEREYQPKLKPQLTAATRGFLKVRREIAGRRPEFHRQEWFRHPRLGPRWRKPDGGQSKLRRHYGYRPNVASIGYRGPKAVRGLHPSGFREVLVHRVRDLDPIDPKLEAARIAATVGARRRTEIEAAADEKGIRVLNRREEE